MSLSENPTEMTSELKNSLITMTSAGEIDRIKSLLVVGQESPSEETIQNLLTIAVKSSHLEIMDFLLTQYPSVSMNEEIVRGAVNTGSIPIFKALLARDPSVVNMPFDKRGTPLTVACMGQQSVEYLQFLLEAGADPNQDPDAASFPLALVAALYTDPVAIDLLLQHGAHLERSGALAAAAQRGNEAMTRYLLDRGAHLDTDTRAMGSITSPLHVAVRTGHVGVARTLLRNGADPNATDAHGATAMQVAEQMMLKGQDRSMMFELLAGEQ